MTSLSELSKEITLCQLCEIAKLRTNVVPGAGPEDAEIMFIGEAPGWHEDQQGLPFVGQAGKYLDGLLALIGLNRGQVYIANVIKCRPPENRDPLPSEIENCRNWLERQVEIIRPRMIVTLGRYSMARYFPGKTISKVHGSAHKHDGIVYFAMYHPAAALHQQSLRQTIEADMCKIPSLLAETKNIQEVKEESQPQQLNMFEG
ncbi:uracil-DNA glycosylase [Chloroflexota bacterium]